MIKGYELFRVIQKKDINKGNIGSAVDTLLDASQNHGVCELKVSDTYASNVEHLNVWLKLGDETEDAYVEDDYVEDDYVEGGDITPATPGRVTEEKLIRVKHCTYVNPIVVRWFGTTGGANYYIFDHKGELGKDHKQLSYKPFIDNLELATATDVVYEKTIGNFIRVGARVDANDAAGLFKMQDAIKIEILSDFQTVGGIFSYKAQQVSLREGGRSIPTPFRSGEVEFIFELPQTFTQRQ